MPTIQDIRIRLPEELQFSSPPIEVTKSDESLME
jgi:virulence-associated protein VagC